MQLSAAMRSLRIWSMLESDLSEIHDGFKKQISASSDRIRVVFLVEGAPKYELS